MSFYNTTHEKGDQLKLRWQQARSQEEKILKFLKDRPYHWFSSESLRLLVLGYKTPITSVRWAVSDLERKGLIQKSPTANALGEYGKNVYTHRYVGGNDEL